MREMTSEERMEMQATILYHLSLAMDDEAAIRISDAEIGNESMMSAIMDDIKTSSDWENDGHYNDDDVRLAIGRVMMKAFHIEV